MSAELVVEHVSKSFGGPRAAVDDVSFVARAGEIVGLLGPSGCGKTTTMRAVAGLEQTSAGRILLGGETVSEPARGIFVKPQRRNVGMVFQSYAVWPHMTVAENVRYPLKHRHLTRAQTAQRVADALAVVKLEDYAQRPATSLSGGQMQRVALARSLVYHPRLLLLDEPLSNLDAKLRLQLRDDLRRIIKDAGVTALYVTHDQSEAVAVGDRIGVMRDGRLLQIATPEELYNRPADLFVAAFTGATNLVTGRATAHAAGVVRVLTRAGTELLARAHGAVADGTEVTVAVRPENLRVAPADADAPASGAWNRIAGAIGAVRFQGVQTGYQVAAGDASWEAIEYGSVARYATGDAVSLWAPLDGCWAFAEKPAQAAAH